MKTKAMVCGLLLVAFFNQANAQDKPKEEFKPSGKLWGYFFGDYYYKVDGANAAGEDSIYVQKGDTTIKAKRWGNTEYGKKAKEYNGFGFRRMYLGYDYRLTENITAKALLEGGDEVLTPSGSRTVYIKSLHVEWKDAFFKQTLMLGQISTPSWSTFAEKQWGYRSVEKTILDARKISRSNDVGIGLSGTLFDFKSSSSDTTKTSKSVLNISYNAMYGNGTGPKPEDNSEKTYYGELIFKIIDHIKIEGFVEYNPSSKTYTSGKKAGEKYNTSTTVMRGFVGYDSKFFSLGVEAFQQIQENVKTAHIQSATDPNKDTTNWVQNGLSVWLRGTIVKDKLYFLGRYDIFNNDANRRGWEYYSDTKNSDVKKYDETFMVFGFDWRPIKNIQVMPNIWVNTYKDKTSNVADYKEIKRKADVVPRMTLFVKF